MSRVSPPAPKAQGMTTERDGRLHGRWLVLARIGWVVVTLVILGMSALAAPHAYVLSQSVCTPGTQCLALQLTQSDLRVLHQLGISPSFVAAYGAGWTIATLLLYTTLAALIFWRRSQERMALFCAYMLVLFGGATYTQLLDIGLRPLGQAWYWPVGVVELLAQVSFMTFFLIFPSGRFVPRWSRWLVPVIVLAEAQYVFLQNQLDPQHGGSAIPILTFAALVFTISGLQIYRYWRVSTSREREQTKWVIFGFALGVGGFVVSTILQNVLFPPALVYSPVWLTLVGTTVTNGFLALIPISIAFAILRSHLYDIDVLINRTLVYGSLTTLLAAVYFGSVVAMQHLAAAVAGPQATANSLIIVLSTLLIAALFTPLRRRIQATIDRRFYRAKYDAAKTVAAFGATLRSETDLGALTEHLMGVVEATMRPSQISLWLRPMRDEVRR